jgi:hypothetical protein
VNASTKLGRRAIIGPSPARVRFLKLVALGKRLEAQRERVVNPLPTPPPPSER